MSIKKRGLGKGLGDMGVGDLLSELTSVAPATLEAHLTQLSIDQLQAGVYQPRQAFDADELNELAQSIRAHGVIQPMVVRPKGDGYEIIAGERRYRAAKLAGCERVPCVVRAIDDQSAMALALIENMQRKDLNAIEQAEGLHRLIDEFGMSHEAIAEHIGKSRSSVSNCLRLLQLHDSVKQHLRTGQLNMGHARSLLSLDIDQQPIIADRVIKESLSVREVEALIRFQTMPMNAKRREPLTDSLIRQQKTLSQRFGTKVVIQQQPSGNGKIVIRFSSENKRDELLQVMQSFST